MSRNDEFDEYGDPIETDGVKNLRSALDKANKANAEQAKQIEELSKKLSAQSLDKLMSDRKVPANIQRWMKRDEVDATAEAVDKWIEENAGDFGWKPGEEEAQPPEQATPPAQPQSVLSPEEVAAQQRIQQMAGPGGDQALDPAKAAVDLIASQINPGTDYATVARMLADAGIPMESDLSY